MIDKYKQSLVTLKHKYSKWDEELSEDITLKEHNLDKISIQKPLIVTKWSRRYLKVLSFYKKLLVERDIINKELLEHFLLDSDIVYKQSEIKIAIKGHKRYIEIENIIIETEEILKFLEQIIDEVKNLHWDIKNFIEYKKLVMGGYI